MNKEFENLLERSKQDTKALQNIDSSFKAFTSLKKAFLQAQIAKNPKHKIALSELASDYFYAAVIKYCKPFTQSKRNGKKDSYPINRVKKYVTGNTFTIEMHKHLMNLRNSLIGHDDYDLIEPRMLTLFIRPRDKNGKPNGSVPVSITTTNMCLAHPLVIESVERMLKHVQSVRSAIATSFSNTLSEIQLRALKYPLESDILAVYSEHLGFSKTTEAASVQQQPDYTELPWFKLENPYEGYHYHTYKITKNFHNQKVVLPNGEVMVISTNDSEAV